MCFSQAAPKGLFSLGMTTGILLVRKSVRDLLKESVRRIVDESFWKTKGLWPKVYEILRE